MATTLDVDLPPGVDSPHPPITTKPATPLGGLCALESSIPGQWVKPYEDVFTHDKKTCQCPRCTGFQPGNTYGGTSTLIHGVWESPMKMGEAVTEKTDIVRQHMPMYHPSFEATLQNFAVCLVRIERAEKYLSEQDQIAEEKGEYGEEQKHKGMRDDLRRWMSQSLRFANALGLTPLAAATILREANPGGGAWRPISGDDLEGVSLDKLKELRGVLAALREDAPIDVEV